LLSSFSRMPGDKAMAAMMCVTIPSKTELIKMDRLALFNRVDYHPDSLRSTFTISGAKA
jgi:hypothetical protein